MPYQFQPSAFSHSSLYLYQSDLVPLSLEESLKKIRRQEGDRTLCLSCKLEAEDSFNKNQKIASLAIRSGNGLLLKGLKEDRRSNAILHKVITSSIPDTVGDKLIGLVTLREETPYLLKGFTDLFQLPGA